MLIVYFVLNIDDINWNQLFQRRIELLLTQILELITTTINTFNIFLMNILLQIHQKHFESGNEDFIIEINDITSFLFIYDYFIYSLLSELLIAIDMLIFLNNVLELQLTIIDFTNTINRTQHNLINTSLI